MGAPGASPVFYLPDPPHDFGVDSPHGLEGFDATPLPPQDATLRANAAQIRRL